MDTNKEKNDEEEEIQCRICANYFGVDEERIYIFHGETRDNCIQGRIQKYLYIKVSMEDKLSKMVCGTCAKKLDGIHQFAMMAHKAQEKLRSEVYGDCRSEIDDDFSKENQMKHSKGLLRTILTCKEEKDIPEIANSLDTLVQSPHFSDAEDTPSTTEEMEVKVDPMIFLQCGLERSLSPEIDDDLDYDETPLHIKDSSQDEDVNQKSNSSSRPLEEPSNDSNQKTYDCTICSRSFASQLSLQNHLWSHLPRADPSSEDEKSLQDSISRGNLSNNPDSDNSSGFGGANSSFVCPICNKKISTKGNLKVHLETHRPKGKYGCDICGRIFKTQSNLFRHKEYHGGIQFPCSVCGRVYPTNSTLRAHSITHSDLRPHACPLCDKTFKRNQDLKFHINQHTGARPYQCPYCPKAFASSGNCFSHRKRMHPREVHRDRQRAADLMR